VAGAYRTIRAELAGYGHGLTEKPELLCLSKIDALDEETVAAKAAELARLRRPARPPGLGRGRARAPARAGRVWALVRERRRAEAEARVAPGRRPARGE
jgi:GTP-binding protein